MTQPRNIPTLTLAGTRCPVNSPTIGDLQPGSLGALAPQAAASRMSPLRQAKGPGAMAPTGILTHKIGGKSRTRIDSPPYSRSRRPQRSDRRMPAFPGAGRGNWSRSATSCVGLGWHRDVLAREGKSEKKTLADRFCSDIRRGSRGRRLVMGRARLTGSTSRLLETAVRPAHAGDGGSKGGPADQRRPLGPGRA